MADVHGGGLDAEAVEILGNSVAHWVSHMFGPSVYELYCADLQAMHGRLHDELLGLLPQTADASIWVYIELDVVDTSIACAVHPAYNSVPPPDADGRWIVALRIHRHDDGTPGVEADNDLVCNLLCALASYGGTVTVNVHPPRVVADPSTPESPVAAGARWQVDPLGTGQPQQERPTLLVSPGGPMDAGETRLRMAVDMTPPAQGPSATWKAITTALWDTLTAYDTSQWQATDPEGFLAALEDAVSRLTRRPELTHPVAIAAAVAHLRQSTELAEQRDEPYNKAVLAAAAAHLAREYSLFTLARHLDSSDTVDPVAFALDAVGSITYYWQATLAGTLLLPPPDPDADDNKDVDFTRLRALIGREFSAR